MCNLHWCYTFCTGVTLFALVLHLNCNQNRVIFSCVLLLLKLKAVADSSVIFPIFFYLFALFSESILLFHDFPGLVIEIINSMASQVFHGPYEP